MGKKDIKPTRATIHLDPLDRKLFLVKDLQRAERIRKLTERDENIVWSTTLDGSVKLYNARSAKKLPLSSLYALFGKILP